LLDTCVLDTDQCCTWFWYFHGDETWSS